MGDPSPMGPRVLCVTNKELDMACDSREIVVMSGGSLFRMSRLMGCKVDGMGAEDFTLRDLKCCAGSRVSPIKLSRAWLTM